MKIQNQYKINQNDSVSKSGKKKSSGASEHVSTEGGTQVELSDSADFVKNLLEIAENTDPQAVRMDVVEAGARGIGHVGMLQANTGAK